ncbi:hypothetical protein Q1695_009151 [Nippostrongylus brasiliensis]|nr:hypothetical protein Q1695_009151 [Nippostrongylus brasiliensis]
MYFFDRTRYVVLVISIICLTLIFSNSIALNFTIICMDDVRLDYYQQSANTTLQETPHWLESSSHINALFSAIAVGCLIGTLPGPFLIHKFGVCKAMAVYGAISALATLALPIAVHFGFIAVFVMRVLQGSATGFTFPAMGLIASQWSTTKGAGTFIALLSCHVQLCSVFTMPVAGALCGSSLGWRAVFYLQGSLSAVAVAVFVLFYRDDPRLHRNVSAAELGKVSRGKHTHDQKQPVPYRAIFTDPCIIGVWLSSVGGSLGFNIFLLYGPTYINKVLRYDVTSTGFAAAVPYVMAAAVKFMLGPISDRATCISDRWRLIFFAVISQGVMAIAFLALVFITDPVMAQIAYTTTIVSSGINAVGVVKCAQMVARQHVHIVMSVTSFLMCVVVLVIPVAVNAICPDGTPEEWSRLFFGISVVVVAANIPFVFVARSEPARWTGNKVLSKSSEKEKEIPEDVHQTNGISTAKIAWK